MSDDQLMLLSLEQGGVPPNLHGGIVHYILHRIGTGSFLGAVLCNDLTEAVLRADPITLRGIGQLVRWLHFNAPGDCWGTPEKVRAWLGRSNES